MDDAMVHSLFSVALEIYGGGFCAFNSREFIRRGSVSDKGYFGVNNGVKMNENNGLKIFSPWQTTAEKNANSPPPGLSFRWRYRWRFRW